MDPTRITVFCFTASYAVAFAGEVWSALRGRRFGWHRPVMLGFAIAGLFAHATYLGVVRARVDAAPLSSPADWSLLAAMVLAAIYLASCFFSPRHATGLFLLPLVLGLIAYSRLASSQPLADDRASWFWGQAHSWLLILATVTVSIGFLAGLMYLIKSWRLKHKLPPSTGFRLPALETLERINGRSLGFSVWLVAGGFISGLVLARIKHQTESAYALWSDPVVISLGVMLGWLVLAEAFRLIYPAARQGRKVAYLTLASFVFLTITLVAMTLVSGVHGQDDAARDSVTLQLTTHPSA